MWGPEAALAIEVDWIEALSCDFSWSERAAILFRVKTTKQNVLLGAKAERRNHGKYDMLNLSQHINETQFEIDNQRIRLGKHTSAMIFLIRQQKLTNEKNQNISTQFYTKI